MRYFPILSEEEGQGLVEYALILVLVSVVVVTSLALFGPQIGDVFSTVNVSITDALSQSDPVPPCNDPTDPACGFTACAEDFQVCHITGTVFVMYGIDDTYETATMDRSFTCLPENYTADPGPLPVPDPAYGIRKTCWIR